MKGVILAGGRGTRLRPITHTGPKQLVPVANKPVIQYGIEDLREAGISEIGVVLGNKGRKEIQAFLGDGSQFGVEITYIVQGEPLGLAHAAACAREFVGNDDFVMYLGDNILHRGINRLVERYQDGDLVAAIALQTVDDPSEFGVAELDSSGTVVDLVEKPADPPSDKALVGVYVFSPQIFDVIETLEPSDRGELEITDAIRALLDAGGTVDAHVVEGWWKDTGRPSDILAANRLVLEDIDPTMDGHVAEGAETSGHIDLAASAVIENGAVVRGPVSIGPDTTVASGTYVGPYTAIGPESILADTHIENSVIVGESTISAPVTLVDSLIGRGATIEPEDGLLPEGQRLVVGENSQLNL